MSQIVGKYLHEKNENMDAYFCALGVPYIGRKMMSASSPTMEISEDDGTWSLKTISFFRTNEIKFKMDEEYEESMPGGILKTLTSKEDDKLKSMSVAEDGTKITRTYDFDETHCIITYFHEKSGQTAKRYFKRA